MQDPDQDLVFPITDGRYLLGVRSSPTTYGHNLEHIENGVKTTDLGRPLSSLELPPAVVREIASDLPTQSIFHQPASYIHFSTLHSHDDIVREDFQKVIYEVDSDDEEWLKQHGVNVDDSCAMSVDAPEHCPSPSSSDISVETFEWIIQWLERRAFKASEKAELYSTHHSAQFDDTPCNICRTRESDDLNQILICDGCEIAVHQSCYGIRSIPDGAWKCEPCSRNLSPSSLVCEFCLAIGSGIFKPIANFEPIFSDAELPEVGNGRIKRIRKQGAVAWGHVQCAKWLAMAEMEKENGEGLIIQRPAKRIDLDSRCTLCSREKGATTKCSEFGCTTRFHILCAQKKAFALFSSRGRYIAYCDRHIPTRFLSWRKEQLRHRDVEKLARRKLKRRRESLALSGGRRSDLTTSQAMRYWGGLAEDDTITKLLTALAKVGRQQDFTEETLRNIFQHWIRKRTKTAGLPLLKSFHPSFVTNTSTVLLNATHGHEIEKVYRKLCLLRDHLEQLRILAATCIERERMKQRQIIARRRLYENVLHPTLGAQSHLLTVASTDLDLNRSFLSVATFEHPYDWLTVLENARAGKYRHDEDAEGGGSFFAALLSVVDSSKVHPSLKEEADVIREKLLKIRDGNVNEVAFTRKPAPLSIVLPKATVDLWRVAYSLMRDNPGYSGFI